MSDRTRHTISIAFVVLVSLTLLAAPARGADWFGLTIGSGGFGIGFGSYDWAVYGSSWSNPGWSVDYHVALSGYGEWIWVDGIGQCWRPWVRADWRPFTYGRWVWTSYGWTWVAYEPWGFFPHHYGHWAMTHSGWVWAPGTTYFAANVVWVQAGARVGWYASPPPGWSHSHGAFHAGYAHGHRDGFSDGYWAGWNDARYATFVDWNALGSDDLVHHAVPATAVRGSAVPRAGIPAPDRGELARRGVSVPEMTLDQRTARVAGRDVMIARPREASASITRNARGTVERALAPAAVQTLERRAADSSNSQRATARSVPPVSRSFDPGTTARVPRADSVERRSSASRDVAGRGAAPRAEGEPSWSSTRDSSRTRDVRAAPPSTAVRTSNPTIEPTAPRGVPSSTRPQANDSIPSSPSSSSASSRRSARPSSSASTPSPRASSRVDSTPSQAHRGSAAAPQPSQQPTARSRTTPSSTSESRSRSDSGSDRARDDQQQRSSRARSSRR